MFIRHLFLDVQEETASSWSSRQKTPGRHVVNSLRKLNNVAFSYYISKENTYAIHSTWRCEPPLTKRCMNKEFDIMKTFLFYVRTFFQLANESKDLAWLQVVLKAHRNGGGGTQNKKFGNRCSRVITTDNSPEVCFQYNVNLIGYF